MLADCSPKILRNDGGLLNCPASQKWPGKRLGSISEGCSARSDKSRKGPNATKQREPRKVLRREKLSIKSVLGVAVILGLTCAQVQAGPKRRGSQNDPRGFYPRQHGSGSSRYPGY